LEAAAFFGWSRAGDLDRAGGFPPLLPAERAMERPLTAAKTANNMMPVSGDIADIASDRVEHTKLLRVRAAPYTTGA
jgi:hypothetical protein